MDVPKRMRQAGAAAGSPPIHTIVNTPRERGAEDRPPCQPAAPERNTPPIGRRVRVERGRCDQRTVSSVRLRPSAINVTKAPDSR